MRATRPGWALLLGLLAIGGCDDGDGDEACASCGADAGAGAALGLELATAAPAEAPAGEVLRLRVRVTADGRPADPSPPSTVDVRLGGGEVGAIAVDGDAVAIEWRLGVAPVKQALEITYGPARLRVETRATRAAPLTSEPFGEVHQFLLDEGASGSTEDLVFVGDAVLMGAPDGVLRVDAEGHVERLPLTGEPLGRGWGLAADDAGTLWVVDAGNKALVRVSTEGEVTTAVTEVEGTPFAGLNYVDVGPDGRIYASDPCIGRIFRYDPATQAVDAVLTFDRATQGGPNGLVFRGNTMYAVTENTVLLCGDAGLAEINAPLANLYRVAVSEAGFGPLEEVATGLGVFGDGITFDAEGNLYVIADTVDGLSLDESIVWVFADGETTPAKFLVADSVLYANLDFGQGAFGERTLYLALLSIPGLIPANSRGLQRIEVGIAGGAPPRPVRE